MDEKHQLYRRARDVKTKSRSRVAAPFEVGGTIRLLHESDFGTAVADLPVESVVAMSDGRHWRVTARRCHASCPTVEVVVDARGRDKDGYVVPESDRCVEVAA